VEGVGPRVGQSARAPVLGHGQEALVPAREVRGSEVDRRPSTVGEDIRPPDRDRGPGRRRRPRHRPATRAHAAPAMPAPTTATVAGRSCAVAHASPLSASPVRVCRSRWHPARLRSARSRPAHPLEPAISTRRRPPARPTGAPSPAADPSAVVPVVGAREPCPCGSGKRYKACHGRTGARTGAGRPAVRRAARRDRVGRAARDRPVGDAPARPADAPERAVVLSTVLPLGLAGAGPQGRHGAARACRCSPAATTSAATWRTRLELALQAEPGSSVVPTGLPGAGARLQDLLSDAPLEPSCTAASSTGSRAATARSRPVTWPPRWSGPTRAPCRPRG
jgi:hypothetical protein